MKAESKFVSIAVAMEMRKLGAPQDTTLFYWRGYDKTLHRAISPHAKGLHCYDAYNSDEILDLFPFEIRHKLKVKWYLDYIWVQFDQNSGCAISNYKPAEAFGKMWCWLRQNGFIDKPEEK